MLTCLPHEDNNADNQDIVAKTIITQKHFSMDSLNYNYLNKYKLQKVGQPSSQPILKIKNLPCTMNGNQLRKVTEIQYGDQKFYIEDVYIISISGSDTSSKKESPNEGSVSSQNIQNSSNDSDNKTQSKKFCLFRKGKGRINSHKRNTKNVAKNFCKAFLNYLKGQKKQNMQRKQLQTCINQVQALTGHKNYYNNSVIWKIISSNVCKEHFKVFLEGHARNWIENSKMEYKDVHLEAIEIYMKLYEKMAFLEGDEDDEDNMQEEDSSGSDK